MGSIKRNVTRRTTKAKTTKAKTTNGKSEFALLPEEVDGLRQADTALGRLKMALADNALNTEMLGRQRGELVASIAAAQEALNGQGQAVAARVQTSPDERWVVDLTKLVIRRV